DGLRDRAAPLLQAHPRQTHLPDESDPPSLRAQGLGRGHRRGAILAGRRPARRRGDRTVLFRMADALMPAAEHSRHDDLDDLTGWNADCRGLRVAVLGLGVTGFAAADTLA